MSLQMEHLSTFPKMRRSVSGLTALNVPETIAVLVICLKDSQDSVYSHIRGRELLQYKEYKANVTKEKRHMGQSFGGNQAQASKSSLPVELNRQALFFPYQVAKALGKCCLLEKPA